MANQGLRKGVCLEPSLACSQSLLPQSVVLGEPLNVVVIRQCLAASLCRCEFKMYLSVSGGGHYLQHPHVQYWHASDLIASICT